MARDAQKSRSSGKKKTSRKKRQVIKIVFMVIVVLLAILLIPVAFSWSKYEKMGKTVIKDKDVKINKLEPETKKTLEGYENIAVFGLDNRSMGSYENGNSDTIIVVSINKETGEIKMVSVYRDTYLDIDQNKFRKANAAYANGGPKQAIEMLNKNLDLDITDYVSVDFNALVDAIDLLGGIEIDTLSPEEAEWLNGYLVETNRVTGHNSENVSSGQNVHLDGVQATAYARIRYVGLDYARTERQRNVITKMFEKAQQCDLLTLNSLMDKLLPQVSTSLSPTELLSLASDVGKYHMGENTGFPFDKESHDVGSMGDMVIPIDLESNVIKLHQFLYANETYTPSQTVKELSETIHTNTGY